MLSWHRNYSAIQQQAWKHRTGLAQHISGEDVRKSNWKNKLSYAKDENQKLIKARKKLLVKALLFGHSQLQNCWQQVQEQSVLGRELRGDVCPAHMPRAAMVQVLFKVKCFTCYPIVTCFHISVLAGNQSPNNIAFHSFKDLSSARYSP